MAPKTAANKGKGKRVAGASDDPTVSSTFLVVHPSIPIPQHGAFGADGTQTTEYDFYYSSLESISMFGDQGQEELQLLSEPSISTFRRLVTDSPLESINCDHIVKPAFLFGDSSEDPVLLNFGTYRWLRTVNGLTFVILHLKDEVRLIPAKSWLEQ
ncbi:uncharacterized protein A4U43_C05F15970 [Asparagus officinalis]|uniref:Uncharacterized protein n=1 Tax=Asparagus officinalis TaxID=4686 RepID=A0A5P1ERX2_ASPOF|nr:uncharacterized protein A4U43_C05F15970 [Asparagus officinalis]